MSALNTPLNQDLVWAKAITNSMVATLDTSEERHEMYEQESVENTANKQRLGSKAISQKSQVAW